LGAVTTDISGAVRGGAAAEGGRFPLGLCIAALVVNGLGLSAALAGVQWGARLPTPDALRFAWLYVNLAVGVNWFLVWPSAALRGGAKGDLLWDLATLLVAAIPALMVSGWLVEATWGMVGRMVALQAALGVFAWGMLGLRNGVDGRAALLAGCLAVLFVALPAVAYIQADFLPMLPGGWHRMAPALAIYEAAARAGDAGGWWVIVGYGLAGAGCLVSDKVRG